MTCSQCGHEPPAGSTFCNGCGAKLVLTCASCGATPPPGSRFCNACGAALGAAAQAASPVAPSARDPQPAPRSDARKVVTILFADLAGSTALHERLDPESVRAFMERYYQAMRAAIDAHGGTLVKLLGDGVMAAFGVPHVAEDDAMRAVQAGADMQEAFGSLAGAHGDLHLRVAVNTGEVVVSADHADIVGDPVNVAARLQQEAQPGDVVLGDATRRLVATRVTLAPLGSITLKGRAEAVAAYRLVSLDPPAGAVAAPFVGRDAELARLEAVFAAAVTAPATRLALLVGSPGLGKSRLIDELARRHADDATILAAHCDAAGGATFAPLAQALRRFLGLAEEAAGEPVRTAIAAVLAAGSDDGDHARIAAGIDGLLTGAPTSPEETFFVVRRFLAGLAAAQPVVLVIDDLHWAEPLLLDLVEHLVQWGSGVPLFVLVGARPELRELRSSLVTPGALVGDVVMLGGLDAGAAMRLAAGVIGAADLPAAVAAKVLATSEGNPLFVGELVRMLVQEGALTREGDRWTAGANLAALEMPPTIHALLAARIERLRPEDRAVLERAAVVGRHFSRGAVAALLHRNGGASDAGDLDARLESLRRSELIERDTGWLLGEPALRFHHVLIRDAAYRRLLKGTRAELHAELADWIERRVGDAPEHDETIGRHLEQAHQLLRELGSLDEAAVVLGERAARRLAAAGRRALARDDVSLAAGLLGRALARLAADAPERADLVLDWCEALLAAGDVGPAADAIAELARVASGASDHGSGSATESSARDASADLAGDAARDGSRPARRLRAWHTCFAGQLTVLTAPEALTATAEQVGAAAQELATLEDAAGEAKAHFVHAQALARLGKVGACEAALDHALAAARRAGDRRRANAVLAGAPLAALWGPSPVTRASGRCLDVVRVLRITQGAPAVEAVALSCQGVLEALRGRTEAARRMLASSRTMVEELGIAHRLHETDVFAGRVDLLEGDARAAERSLRAGYEGLRDLGLGIDAARAAALLGRALLAQDRAAEAETLSHESELLAGDDLQAAIAWRGVRAEALARRGEHAAAIAFAEAAVAIAAATDALLDHADARLALAAALRTAGRGDDADAEARRALELWEAKGATLLVERTRRADAPVAVANAGPERRSAPAMRRRITANRATAALVAFNAAAAARDFASFRELMSETYEEIDHPTGVSYGRDANVASLERLMRSRDASCRLEPLATLGDAVVLCRRRVYASATGGGRFDVGEYEQDAYTVMEVDARERFCRHEVFAADHLLAAVARLFERHASLLPAGPERDRAAASARTVALHMGPIDAERWAARADPSVEHVDHRMLGTWHAHGKAEYLAQLRWQNELATGFTLRTDEVLAVAPHAVLARNTYFGVVRSTGGAFENVVLNLWMFGASGLVTRGEIWEPDHDAEALARFDELVRGAEPGPTVRRRVTPNAGSAAEARIQAALDAGDFDAFAAQIGADFEEVHHPTGATSGREAMLHSVASFLRVPGATARHELLATLGDRLWLSRGGMGASAAVRTSFDARELEKEELRVHEVDEHGLAVRNEVFAGDRLGDALVRFYQRWAEMLPEGAERARAVGMARSVAATIGPIALDRLRIAYDPSFRCVDHRVFSTWSAGSADDMVRHYGLQLDLAPDFAGRYDDVFAATTDAVVARMTFFGTSRDSGGRFENHVCTVFRCGADGRLIHTEVFEAHQTAEALACFDALTAPVTAALPLRRGAPVRRRPRANRAMTATLAFEAAVVARDANAVARLFHEALTVVDHQNGATYGRDGHLASVARLLRARDPELRAEPLATLGADLVLWRRRIRASGTSGGRFDVGEFEREELVVFGVDDGGTVIQIETFASDRLCQALGRLYELYAESIPGGPERTRAARISAAQAIWDGPIDVDRVANVVAPSFACVDHRSLGTWSSRGREAHLRHYREQAELAVGFSRKDQDLLAFAPAVNVARSVYFGTSRATGGPFENVVLAVHVFDADGLLSLAELFEPEQETEALARFDALVAAESPPPRRVRANAATRSLAGFEAIVAARDRDALAEVFAESLHFTHHPTGATYGRREMLSTWRSILKAERVSMRAETLASLGDALALERHFLVIEGLREDHVAAFGPSEFEEITVIEVDDQGRWRRVELFAPDHLADALVRLRERHAELLPAGPARDRAAATARTDAALRRGALMAAALAPTVAAVDHRTVGFGTLRGRDAVVGAVRALLDLADDLTWRTDDVLALSEYAGLVRATQRGRDGASGGEWERPLCSLYHYAADGLLAHWEIFEPEQEAAALARYDALVGGSAEAAGLPPHETFFANAATRALDRVAQVTAGRDWAGLADTCAASLRFDDRRPLFRMQLPKEGFLAQHRVLFDVPNARWVMTPIATRGERLALSRILLQGEVAGGGGALEIDHIGVIEVDDDGRMTAIVLFEPAELDAAYAQLDARYEAGEAAIHAPLAGRFRRALADHDWDALAALCGPGFASHDHRSLALLGTTHGPEAWTDNLRALVELAPDTVARFAHVRWCPRGSIGSLTWEGSRAGGRYEIPMVAVTELDGCGKVTRLDFYDPEQLDQARARFAELAATPPPEPFANAATRTMARQERAWAARDWHGCIAAIPASYTLDDRRPLVRLRISGETFFAQLRMLFELPGSRWHFAPLATRGERLVLGRVLWESDVDASGGEAAADYLEVFEVDANGVSVESVRFDPKEEGAARAELDRRSQTGEAESHPRAAAYHGAFVRALAARDWEALGALHAPTLVAHDHRLVGWDVLRGPEAYVGAMRAMVELAPDAQGRLEHLRTAEHGLLAEVVWVGTRDGGAFESPFLWVVELAADGRAQRLDFYDPHHLDAARARFAELDRRAPPAASPARAERPRDPIAALAKSTLATAAMDRWLAAYDAGFETGRWEALRALLAPGYVFDDRRRLALLHGGVELMLASLRERAATGARAEWTVVGAAGERILIGRMLWSGGPSDGRFEIEYVGVVEVDEAGLIVANVLYDLADVGAARRDAWTRWAAIESGMAGWLGIAAETSAGFDTHDRARLRALFADDLIVEDHRWTGFGRTEGADAYLDSLVALWSLAPDQRVELGRFWPAVGPHGVVTSVRREGTLPGGGAFESDYLFLFVALGGRITRIEMFELDDLERAVARLAELRPDLLRIPPNAMARTFARWAEAIRRGDEHAVMALYAPSYALEDRRPHVRTSSDAGEGIGSVRWAIEGGWTGELTLLATAGDRLALHHGVWRTRHGGARSEIACLHVDEVDAEGRLVRSLVFDPGDRAAAYRVLAHRYTELTRPLALPRLAALQEAGRDLARLRAALPDGFVFYDRRRTGLGRLDGADAYLASVAALHDLAPDAMVGQPLYFLADAPHATLAIAHSFGRLADGGAYESVYAMITLYGPNGMVGAELFELEHLDAARARFDELRH